MATQDLGVNRVNRHDLFYTRDDVAQHCVQLLLESGRATAGSTWIEPAAGTGAFLRAVENLTSGTITPIALDLLPRGPDITQTDFLAWEPLPHKDTIVYGNPPFGRSSVTARAFIRHAALFADTIAFILPRSFTKPSMQSAFPSCFHLLLSESLPHHSFIVNDKPHDVPCVFQIWVRKPTSRAAATRVDPVGFEYTRGGEYDLAIRRVGATAGTAYLPSLVHHNPNTHYFITLSPSHRAHARRIMELVNEQEFPTNTTGARSISQSEINVILNPLLHRAR